MSWDIVLKSLSSQQNIIMQVSLVFALVVIGHYLETYLYRKLIKKLKTTQSIWDEALVTAFHKPLGVMLWIVGITYSLQLMSQYTPDVMLFDLLPSLRQGAVVLLLSWFLLRFIKRLELQYLRKEATSHGVVDVTTANAVSQILRIIVLVAAILLILPIFLPDFEMTGLLALGGAGTVIAGLAAQDLLSNFFGALTIYLDRPFAVGDWIKSPDRELEGTVEYIGWRLTRIRTFDQQPLFVPNSVFSKISVQNPSRMSNRRIREVIGLRYQDSKSLSLITSEIRQMLMNHPEIDTTKSCFVNLISFSPSSLDVLIYTFTKTVEWIPFQAIKQDIMLLILDIVAKHGAQVAFPTRTVEVAEIDAEHALNLSQMG